MLGGLGTTEILIVLGILILLFGAKQIPKLARSFGESRRELRRAMRDAADDRIESNDNHQPRRRIANQSAAPPV